MVKSWRKVRVMGNTYIHTPGKHIHMFGAMYDCMIKDKSVSVLCPVNHCSYIMAHHLCLCVYMCIHAFSICVCVCVCVCVCHHIISHILKEVSKYLCVAIHKFFEKDFQRMIYAVTLEEA